MDIEKLLQYITKAQFSYGAVPKKLKMNPTLINKINISKNDKLKYNSNTDTFTFNNVPVEEDDSVDTFKFEW